MRTVSAFFFSLSRRSFFLALSLAVVLSVVPRISAGLPLDPIDAIRKSELRTELTHVPWNGEAVGRTVFYDFQCWVSRVDIPVTDSVTGMRSQQRLWVVQPDSARKVPVVIVIPTIEGRTILEHVVANQLCARRIAAVIADVNRNDAPEVMPSWHVEDTNHRRAIHALRTTIDFLQAQPEFLPDKIGVMGMSLGGISTAMLLGVEPRLSAGLIAAGGGNFPAILSYSKSRRVGDFRQRRMDYLGIQDPALYELELRKRLRHDPLHFADEIDPANVLMLLVRNDGSVPEPTQVELWERLRKPEAVWFDRGHVGSLIALGAWYMTDVAAFFHERFRTWNPERIRFDHRPWTPPRPNAVPQLPKTAFPAD